MERDFVLTDAPTPRKREAILAVEEKHSAELADLLQEVPFGLKARPRAVVQ